MNENELQYQNHHLNVFCCVCIIHTQHVHRSLISWNKTPEQKINMTQTAEHCSKSGEHNIAATTLHVFHKRQISSRATEKEQPAAVKKKTSENYLMIIPGDDDFAQNQRRFHMAMFCTSLREALCIIGRTILSQIVSQRQQ